jgi:hypothetical protein
MRNEEIRLLDDATIFNPSTNLEEMKPLVASLYFMAKKASENKNVRFGV